MSLEATLSRISLRSSVGRVQIGDGGERSPGTISDAGNRTAIEKDEIKGERVDVEEGWEGTASRGAEEAEDLESGGFDLRNEEGGKCLDLYFWSTASSS